MLVNGVKYIKRSILRIKLKMILLYRHIIFFYYIRIKDRMNIINII